MSSSGSPASRVLVVEDEVLIGIVLEDILDMLGYSLAGNATSIPEARVLVDRGGFDIAILDVNVGSEPIFPLADAIRAAGVPVVFATGALRDSLPPRFADCEVLEKPYAVSAVEEVLAKVSGRPPVEAGD